MAVAVARRGRKGRDWGKADVRVLLLLLLCTRGRGGMEGGMEHFDTTCARVLLWNEAR